MEDISVQTRMNSLIKYEGQPDVMLERNELGWLFLSNETQDFFFRQMIKSQAFGFLTKAKSLQPSSSVRLYLEKYSTDLR